MGQNIYVGQMTWNVAKEKAYIGFLSDLIGIIWKRRIDNMCLDPSKVKNSIPNWRFKQLLVALCGRSWNLQKECQTHS